MIIKITFNDNDYTQLIERYLDVTTSYTEFFALFSEALDSGDYNITRKLYEQRDIFRAYIREGITKMSKADKELFEGMLKLEFLSWLKENTQSYDYLEDNLKITITNRLYSKWENGEVVYYFPSQHKYITQ